jgi:multidrug transporter EmrE-like cation transporter
VTLFLFCASYAVLNASGLLLMRLGLKGDGGGKPVLALLLHEPRLAIGIFCYGLSFLIWLLALRSYALAIVYPLFIGVGYSSVVLASFIILHEHASLVRLVGIAFVGVGVVLVAR